MNFHPLGICLSVTVFFALAATAATQSAIADTQGERERTHLGKQHSGELVRAVRDATRRFHDVNQAKAEGYQLLFGCVSGPDDGAMGLHYVNLGLVADGILDPKRPEIVIYEPLPNGKLKLIGADYLVDAAQWHAKHGKVQPQIMGQLLHLFEAPNRFGLDPFYTLHVWAWKDNPTGTFVNWHANVSCDAFPGDPD